MAYQSHWTRHGVPLSSVMGETVGKIGSDWGKPGRAYRHHLSSRRSLTFVITKLASVLGDRLASYYVRQDLIIWPFADVAGCLSAASRPESKSVGQGPAQCAWPRLGRTVLWIRGIPETSLSRQVAEIRA
jgi:hypothetical protein